MTQRPKNFQIRVAEVDVSAFLVLLAEGFRVEATVGVSLADLLCRQMGIDPAYIQNRVQTIFLNGRAVDDIFREIVFDGAVIALSAAMPGLAGAVFRRGGILAAMRSQGAGPSPLGETASHSGRIILKLFNLIARELGPRFLEAGFCMDQKRVLDFLRWKYAEINSICRKVIIEGEEYDFSKALSVLEGNGEVVFSVRRE